MTNKEIQDNVSKAKEIAKEYSRPYGFGLNSDSSIECYQSALEAMQWKDEIMEKRIESAVSAEVGYFNQRGLSIYFNKSLEKLGFEEGDKVKVLILKEDKL